MFAAVRICVPSHTLRNQLFSVREQAADARRAGVKGFTLTDIAPVIDDVILSVDLHIEFPALFDDAGRPERAETPAALCGP